MAALMCREILGMKVPETDRELNEHRQQRQQIRRATRAIPPNNE